MDKDKDPPERRPVAPSAAAKPDRLKREAAALRENLRKRKKQLRARGKPRPD